MYSAEDLFTEEPDLETVREAEETENIQDEDEEAKDDDDVERKVIKPKRTCNPQPKLNDQLLIGPKGLNIVKDYFKNVKYKGKGRESEDLRTIMKIYEHWCHRLFPKYPFNDCIAKIENLGYKKTVKTYVKKIRMNMLQTDIPEEENDDNVEEESVTSNNIQPTSTDLQLTADQIERIHLNKEHAKQLREERLRKIQEKVAANMENMQRSQNLNDSEAIFTQLESTTENNTTETDEASEKQSGVVEMETIENNITEQHSEVVQIETIKNNTTENQSELIEIETDENDMAENQSELVETETNENNTAEINETAEKQNKIVEIETIENQNEVETNAVTEKMDDALQTEDFYMHETSKTSKALGMQHEVTDTNNKDMEIEATTPQIGNSGAETILDLIGNTINNESSTEEKITAETEILTETIEMDCE